MALLDRGAVCGRHPEAVVEVWICRHGETSENQTRTAAGWNTGELSAAGLEQARQLATRLRDVGFDAMYVSDLRRTEMTAQQINAVRKIPLEWVSDSRLREKGAGVNEGKPIGISEGQARRQGISARIFRPACGGESWEDVATRARSFIRSLVRSSALSPRPHGRNLVITHGGWIKAKPRPLIACLTAPPAHNCSSTY